MTGDESLLAAIYEEVALLPHDRSWPAAFIVERDRLLALFPAAKSEFVRAALGDA